MKNKHNNGIRYCPNCKHKLKKNGTDRNGVQRGCCKHCNKTYLLGKKKKKNNKILNDTKLYFDYSTNKLSMSQYGFHRSTVYRHIKDNRNKSITIPANGDYHRFIFLDGKGTDNICTLIARNKFYVFKGQHVEKENAENGYNFIKDIPEPEVVICDCQKGLLNAIKLVWPSAKIQFCNFHRLKAIDRKLTKNPILQQAKELRQIRLMFGKIQSFKEKYEFIETIEKGTIINTDFLKERTICLNGKRKGFYTHKNIRAAGKILLNSARSEYTFQYLETPGCPSTNNHLEAGINSQIEKLRNAHQGQTLKHRINMLEAYLFKRSKHGLDFVEFISRKKVK